MSQGTSLISLTVIREELHPEEQQWLSRSKALISSLNTHLTSYVSHERTRLRSRRKVHFSPEFKCSPQRIAPRRAVTGYISHERTRSRSCPMVHPYQAWPWSIKNHTRESSNGLSGSKSSITSLSDEHVTSPMKELRLDLVPLWRRLMETFYALQALCAGNSPATGEFPSQRPVTRSFDVFFDLHLNKRLSKKSRRQWFETSSCSLWRHCNAKEHPYHVSPHSTEKLRRSKSLISSLSANLMSYVSYERTWPRSCPKEHPYLVWPRSTMNCSRGSGNGAQQIKIIN